MQRLDRAHGRCCLIFQIAKTPFLLLDNLLGVGPDKLDREECVSFVRWTEEALDLLKQEKYQVAFLVNPCSVEEIKTLVRKGERFPQKTTDFYPKMITGLVFCRLHFQD